MNGYAATQAAVDRRDDRLLKSVEQQAHEARVAANLRYERAQAIAHDPDALTDLQADGKLTYVDVLVKIDGQSCDLFEAADRLRLRVMRGLHGEADCIARDMTDALAAEIERLLAKGAIR